MIHRRRKTVQAKGTAVRQEIVISSNQTIDLDAASFVSVEERLKLIEEIGSYWSCARSFWIFTHEYPDGDALGCNLAMYAVLTALGKDVKVFSYDPVPRMYRFLPHADKIIHDTELPLDGLPDVIQINDNAAFERLGKNFAHQLTEMGIGPKAVNPNSNCTILNLDHHIGNERFGHINLVDAGCGACGELLYHAFKHLKMPITLDVAINLYAAIITDTGRFSYSNTSSDTFYIASELIRKGVDPFDVVNRVYNTRTVNQMQLLARVMDTIKVEDELGYFLCTCSNQMLTDTQTVLSDTEGVTDLMKTVGDYEVLFFFRELDNDRIKVSVRSNGVFNVRHFARKMGGGGHTAASGFTMDGPLEQATEIIREKMREHLDELAKDGSRTG